MGYLYLFLHPAAFPRQVPLLHPLNGLFSTTTWLSRQQKGKISLYLNEARGNGVFGWQWHHFKKRDKNKKNVCKRNKKRYLFLV